MKDERADYASYGAPASDEMHVWMRSDSAELPKPAEAMTTSRETFTLILLTVVVTVALGLVLAMASGPSSAQRRCLAAVETFGPPEMAATCREL